MDKYEPTLEDLIKNEYYYYYDKILNNEITWDEWEEIKDTIQLIKDLIKKLNKHKK